MMNAYQGIAAGSVQAPSWAMNPASQNTIPTNQDPYQAGFISNGASVGPVDPAEVAAQAKQNAMQVLAKINQVMYFLPVMVSSVAESLRQAPGGSLHVHFSVFLKPRSCMSLEPHQDNLDHMLSP